MPAPLLYWVAAKHAETADTSTLTLRPQAEAIPEFVPGQFAMVHALGCGEVPVAISGDPAEGNEKLVLTVKGVDALQRARSGTTVAVRGPFGTGWDLVAAKGTDLVLVATGIGLAPLRPVLLHALRHRTSFRRIVLIAGIRERSDLLYADEIEAMATNNGIDVVVTIDRDHHGWFGHGKPLATVRFDPTNCTAMLSGPVPMMRSCAELLVARGVPTDRIQISLDLTVQPGIGLLGPVVTYPRAAPVLYVPHLRSW